MAKGEIMAALTVLAFEVGAVNVKVNLGEVKGEVPRTMYGTGMEDVNHEIYGGLDAQRLWDESFEEGIPPKAIPYAQRGKGGILCGRQWDGLACGDGMFARDSKVAHYGKASGLLAPGSGHAGFANRGLNGWGVPCREGKKMLGHFYAKGVAGALEVRLERADGRVVYAKSSIPAPSWSDWTKVVFELRPDRTDPAARFAVVASGGGRLWIDDAYLVDEPTNDFGRMGCREDIVAAFRKQGVSFLRWGGSMVNAPDYLLKNMTGERRPYEGYWFKKSSSGFMIREFVQMAEIMKLPCAFSIHAYDTTEDAVDLAKWLKRFTVDIYVEIGNEECAGFTPAGGKPVMEDIRRYCENLRRLVPAMRAANPRLKFVNAVMWDRKHMDLMEEAFRLTDGYVEYWDIHVYTGGLGAGNVVRAMIGSFRDMITRINPKTTMKAAIFEENGYIHDMQRAIGHARALEAVREMGDFVLTSCPANALQAYMQNDNGWDQGQIFYTTDKVWFQPYGWAQQMASASHRDVLVAGSSDCPDVTVSATRSRDGTSVVVHLVCSAKEAKPLKLDFGKTPELRLVRATSLSAPRLEDHNPPDDSDRISPKDVTESFRSESTLMPFSYTIIEYSL